MTLKDKFLPHVDCIYPIDGFENKEWAIRNAKECEQIAEEFAIEILERYHNSIFHIPLKEGEAKKIVEHIKKEL